LTGSSKPESRNQSAQRVRSVLESRHLGHPSDVELEATSS
jgi:hypothetical protein